MPYLNVANMLPMILCVGLTSLSIKETQYILHKTITWTKKSGKGRQEWHKACMNSSVPPWKLKTLVKTKFVFQVILFQETLEFKHTITLCYGRQQSLTLQGHVKSPQVWVVAQIVANTLGPMHGSTMCVESKSRLFTTFGCPCCGNFICMSNANILFDT